MSSPQSSSLQRMIQTYSPMVDQALRELINREEAVPMLHEGLLYSMGLDDAQAEKGKRLRPILCLAATEALGGNTEDALSFACAIELMHNFALVHDDIEDGDQTRRDRPCTYIKYGLANGINMGDYLFCKVLSTLLYLGPESDATRMKLMRLMSETLDHTHVGQALDINARDKQPFALDDYFRLVREKTGYYLAAPIQGAAIVSGANNEIKSAIAQYGHYIGPLFQITDDTLDLTVGKGRGGMVGSDIREGKRSFMVAYVCENSDDSTIQRMFEVLNPSREETSDADIQSVIEIFTTCGAIEAAKAHGEELLENGLNAIRILPAPLEGLLREFAHSLVDRKK